MWPIVEVVAKISKNQILFNIEVYWILSRSTLAILSTIQLQYILAKYSCTWLYFEKKRWGLQRSWATPPFSYDAALRKSRHDCWQKEQHQKSKQQQKENIRLSATASSLKNISRFRPYKKVKNNNEKICEIKAAHIKNQNMCCWLRQDSFISTIVTKNRKVPFYLNGLFIKTFFCLYYTAWLRKAQRRIGQIDPQV